MRILQQSWTPKRLTRLRQLWEVGLDNEQLADAMQTTKPAVVPDTPTPTHGPDLMLGRRSADGGKSVWADRPT